MWSVWTLHENWLHCSVVVSERKRAAGWCLRIRQLPQLSPTPAEKKISSTACCKMPQPRWHLRERRGITLRCVVPFPCVKGEAPTQRLCKPLLNQTGQSFGWGVWTLSTTFTRPKGSGSNTHLWPAWRHVFGHNIVGLMFAKTWSHIVAEQILYDIIFAVFWYFCNEYIHQTLLFI